MPDFEDATAWLNGKRTKAELVGKKPTLVHFWSVSCQTCKDAMPGVHKLRDQFKQHLNVIAVHYPRSEADLDLDLVKANAARYDITEPICIDGDLKLSTVYGNELIPSYYVFDKNGRLRHFQAGGGGMMMLERRIQRVLQEIK